MAHELLQVVETDIAEQAMKISAAANASVPASASSGSAVPSGGAHASRPARSAASGSKVQQHSQGDLDKDQTERDELIRKSQLAYGILMQSLQDEQLRLVQGVARGNAHGVWKILLETYERKSMATQVQLLERLFGMQVQKGETIAGYVARLTEIERRLRAQGEQVSEGIMVYMLLRGLPASYTSIVQLIKMKDKLEFVETVESLKNEEERQACAQPGGSSAQPRHQANGAETNSKRRCFTCGAVGHVKFNCPRNASKPKCQKCFRVGHESTECRGEWQANTAEVIFGEEGAKHGY